MILKRVSLNPTDKKPKWFVALSAERFRGPLTQKEVIELVSQGMLSWAHFAADAKGFEWKRLSEIQEFEEFLPQKPQLKSKQAQALGQELALAIPAEAEPKIWFIHTRDAQYGPFMVTEIVRFIRIKKIGPKTHAWRDGMSEWISIDSIPELVSAMKERLTENDLKESLIPSSTEAGQSKEKPPTPVPAAVEVSRRQVRKPMVARLLMINERDSSVQVGLCRDISLGGMQVLTEKVPGPVGTRIKLNVSPAGDLERKKIKPFVADGVIVRVLEDESGFSFRFDKLPDDTKKAIEDYLNVAAV